MKLRRFAKNRTATILTDYLILLGVVALALVAMQTYVKRGIQGQVKEMTDYFIGGEQAIIVDPTVHSVSVSNSAADSSGTMELSAGGLTRTTGLETISVDAHSRSAAQESEIKKADYLKDVTTGVDTVGSPEAQTGATTNVNSIGLGLGG